MSARTRASLFAGPDTRIWTERERLIAQKRHRDSDRRWLRSAVNRHDEPRRFFEGRRAGKEGSDVSVLAESQESDIESIEPGELLLVLPSRVVGIRALGIGGVDVLGKE